MIAAKSAVLQERISALWIVIALAGSIMGLRLVQLQIIENAEYVLAAERNRTQMIYQTAPRGRIYDRNGVPLATNQAAFSLIYLPGKRKDHHDLKPLARSLAKELKKDEGELFDTLQAAVREESALRLAENLPPQTMFRLSELKTIYPGVDLIVEARRYYPFGRFGSHLLGFMGRMDPREWRERKLKGYRVDSRIGRLGLERVFEDELRGRDGGIRMEVDAQGRLKRILERKAWEPGSNVHLTLDAAAQKAADEGLHDSTSKRGAVVALDPRTGAILALSSSPDFDPNDFQSSDPAVVKKISSDIPEFNLAIAGAYPPGSIFKIIVGAAALNEGRVTTEDSVFCPGYFELGSHIFLCWNHKGHKKVSWLQALAHSCDVYFYRMGLKTGGSIIERYSRMFGLGAETKVALRGEKRGHLFGPQSRGKSGKPWYDGDTVNLSIGQGELLVTPMQMALMMSAIANRGTLWRPHYTERVVYSDGRPEYKQLPERLGEAPLKERTWDDLQGALRLVVSSGTGVAARIDGLEVFGKTGTAQNSGGDDHAWFVSYARRPGESAQVAVAVLVENGGHGSSAAAPIARAVMMAAYGLSDHKAAPATALPLLPSRPALLPALRGTR
ncbi:MAG: penicillin-binding protein 2 [Elusimicrobiota bacterium]